MKRFLRNRILVLVLTVLLAFSLTMPVGAEGLITGDTIPAGTVYDHDAILIGENVVIDGTIDGNAFILGNQVTINGQVNGSVILLGQNAGIAGAVTGEVYGVVLTLDLAPNASIGRDLYVATASLTSGKASTVGRDLYAVGLDSGLNGQVGRDLHTVIGPIQLYNGLMTLLGYDNLTIKLHFEAPPQPAGSSGNLLSPAGPGNARLSRIRLGNAAEAAAQGFDWDKWGLGLLRNWAVLFIFGLLAFWLARPRLVHSGEAVKSHPWKSLGLGLVVLVLSLASVGAALLLGLILFAVGLGLNALGVWPLTLALWAAGYACLAVTLVALWAFIAYGTKIIVFYFVAGWIFDRLIKQKTVWVGILAVLAGSIVYALLRSIPYAGWIFDILVTAVGAGSAWQALRSVAKKPVEASLPAAALPAEMPVEPVPPVPAIEPAPLVASVEPKVLPAKQPALKLPRKRAKSASPTS